MSQTEAMNQTQQPRIGKIVVNISVGKSGEQLQRAMTVLERLVGQRPCQRRAKRTVREWGIRQNEPIACVVTLRGGKAMEFLKKSLDAVGNRILKSSFDVNGNFNFGIKEHIELAGVRYDPSLGIFGMDICVAMEKQGYRVKRRRIRRTKVGKNHTLKPEEAIEYFKETFGTDIRE